MRWMTALLFSAIALNAVAQDRQPRSAWRYDATKEATFEGTVSEVAQVRSGRGPAGGTHATLDTATGKVDVRLGPSSYLSSQGIALAKGDKASVIGSKAGTGADWFVIARELTVNGKTVTLRDKSGVPMWSRGRR